MNVRLAEAVERFRGGQGQEGEWSRDDFRAQLEENLARGKLRLVIVVDKVNDELKRTIEFLNECTSPAFQIVCAELRHFATATARLLVPALIGTPKSPPVGPSGPPSHTTPEIFLTSLPPDDRPFFSDVLDEARRRRRTIYWGRKGFSIRAALPDTGRVASLAYGYPNGAFELYVGNLPAEQQQPTLDELEAIGQQMQRAGAYTLRALHPTREAQPVWRAFTAMLDKADALPNVAEL